MFFQKIKTKLVLPDSNGKYLLALSGGVDSIVLFDILIKLKINFDVIHINHLTRGVDNLKDYYLTKKLTNDYHKEHYYFEYQHHQGNFQKKSREFRIKCYQKIFEQGNYDGVFLAHHADDQVENIMMNAKKLNPKLMDFQIKIQNVYLYRPLLKIYKKEIYQYAQEYQLSYQEDYSNKQTKYLRNYWRQKITKISEEQKKRILKQQELVVQEQQVIKEKSRKQILTKEDFMKVKNQELLLYFYLKQKIKKNISAQLIKMIVANLNFCGEKQFYLPDNYILFQSYNKLCYHRIYKVEIEEQKKILYGINCFNGINFFCPYDKAIVRVKIPGDKIKIKSGHKKVSRVLIDQKIPKFLRNRWPIIVNEKTQEILVAEKLVGEVESS